MVSGNINVLAYYYDDFWYVVIFQIRVHAFVGSVIYIYSESTQCIQQSYTCDEGVESSFTFEVSDVLLRVCIVNRSRTHLLNRPFMYTAVWKGFTQLIAVSRYVIYCFFISVS